MDITSYLLGKNASGGGSGEEPKLLSEMNNFLKDYVEWFNGYINNISSTYNTFSTETTTLYTPDINYKYYLIQKRSGGTYRVVWVKSVRVINDNSIYPSNIRAETMILKNNEPINMYRTLGNYITTDEVYYSPEYNDIETCVQKMKNNELTYTKVNNFLGYVPDTTAKIPVANVGIYYYKDNNTPEEFVMPSKISSKEIITSI